MKIVILRRLLISKMEKKLGKIEIVFKTHGIQNLSCFHLIFGPKRVKKGKFNKFSVKSL